MLKIELDESSGIVTLQPDGEISEHDFKQVSTIVNPYLENHNELKGLIIHVKSFPGWDSFSSMIEHVKFVKDHQKRIRRIAIVTDSPIGEIAEKVASHFVSAEIKKFHFDELEKSKSWLLSNDI